MKTILKFSLILICLVSASCKNNEKSTNSFTIQGSITGLDTGTIVLQSGIFKAYHSDTAKIKNGKFSFTGEIIEPTRSRIIGGNALNSVDIYLEPGLLKVNLVKDQFKNVQVIGSKSQEELNKLNKLLDAVTNQDSVYLDFVLKNPKSFLAPYYLQKYDIEKPISLDSLKSIFRGFDPAVQNSRYGRKVQGQIRKKENSLEGAIATEFKAIDIDNQIITLSQFRGRNVVLLDFWANWCVPCRKSMPHLKSLYNKYHSKGLEIIAITYYEKNKDNWISAIKEDSINMWHHLPTSFRNNGETINEDILLDYSISPIPRTILIDIQGKIRGNWAGYTEENEESLDKKIAELIDNK
jgi:thiol-disulfide isomerase/thioredoxin